jgi:hypothetical protein
MAAAGEYGRADEYLMELGSAMEHNRTEGLFALFRGDVVPAYPPPMPGYILQSFGRLNQMAAVTQDWADLLVVRACLALEGGDTEIAERQFQRARSLVYSAQQPAALAMLLAAPDPLAAVMLLERQRYAAAGSHLNFPGERLMMHYLGQIQLVNRDSSAQ